jgi:hypothetical protein
MRARLLFGIGWAALFLIAGCGPSKVKITGKILRNGAPVTYSEAEVEKMTMPAGLRFITAQGGQSYPAKFVFADGTYSVELPAGKYRVNVFIPPKNFDPGKPGSMPPPVSGRDGEGEVFDLSSSQVLDLNIK